ncbi:hypothetical protein QTP86_014156 [Hemibagrus guttatus]|nr:hypothetical protein QTP86_014156 [Hemibagrus guttatus]
MWNCCVQSLSPVHFIHYDFYCSIFQTNGIKTSKYNVLTFLPLNLFEQFQRIANAYFLCLLVLQVIPAISSLSWFTTVVPLALVLTVTAVKDAIDDIHRHRSDRQVNNRKAEVLINEELRSEKWMNIQVGDIIRLENNQFVTADLLLLSSSEPMNLVYIETAELDGETNLKVKQALTVTGEMGGSVKDLAAFKGEVSCEPPNNRLDRFSGTLVWKGHKHPLDNQSVLLRGCTLRNTAWCFGMVLFAGGLRDDWLMMESELRDDWLMMESELRDDWLMMESELRDDWLMMESELRDDWLMLESELRDDWLMMESELRDDWLMMESELRDDWLMMESEHRDDWLMLESELRDDWLMMESELRDDWLMMESELRDDWLMMESSLLTHRIFGFLVLMCVILAVGHGIWEHYEASYTTHIPRVENAGAAFSAFLTFWSYIIILNTVVPISLYVSMEVIRLGNSYYINWDRLMYHERSDTPAEARTTTLNEELGQINYVFSDKTGTLTQNIMNFNKCSIGGKTYGDVIDHYTGQRLEISEDTLPVDFSFNDLADPKFQFFDAALLEAVKLGTPQVCSFFRLLALCHTVMPDETNNELVYQAQSPDEGALVTAARNFGFVFRSRTPESLCVVELGEARCYELLAILDFNNVRKRMSVIVRSPEGQLSLYCKGADTIVYERLDKSCGKLMEVTTEHLNEFAGEGLRTLVLAYKDLDEQYFSEWKQRHHEASTLLEQREEKLNDLYEEIEQDLQLLGATAIEDKLQDGVAQTIEQLTKADIKIWVLTGDKQETAENIGYSCNLLREEMTDIFIVSANSYEEVRRELRDARLKIRPDSGEEVSFISDSILGNEPKVVHDENVSGDYGLVINGHSLAYALEHSMELEFLRTACMCKTVICCRVTPLQKARVVELVKKYKQAVTLAIGDGANDVSMIKAAHIGVGISGQEGMQAVLSSDFSFAQFRYLQRLLLVHGRWSYLRMSKFLRYFFYKNFTFTFVHFWYAFFCGFSAQTVYDQAFIALYNLMYTALPVLGMGLFDQDVNDSWGLEYPQLYVPGQLSVYFNKGTFVKCALHSCYSSLVLFFVPYLTLHDTADYQSFALLTQTCLIITVCVQVRFMVHQMKSSQPPPPRRRTRIRRSSTRRSGYAFSHTQGYGDLVTSKWFLRRQAPARAPGFTPTSRTARFSPTGKQQNSKQEVEPTQLQNYRVVKDSVF